MDELLWTLLGCLAVAPFAGMAGHWASRRYRCMHMPYEWRLKHAPKGGMLSFCGGQVPHIPKDRWW